MGNQKQKWTADEEDALHRGIQKYGPGKWKNILKDPDFAPFLTSRSNIDLKDKWRNLNVSNGQGGPKDKSRTPKPKAIVASSSTPASASVTDAVPLAVAAPQSVVSTPQSKIVDDSPSNAEDSKNPPRYNAMVFEALSTIKDANGADANAISSYIQQNHKVPTNFRRALSTRLKRLVSQGKIEKVQNGYKIKDTPSGTKSPSPSPKPKDAWPRQSPASSFLSCSETVREAAATAAYRIAEAENKAFLAAEAFKEVDRLSQMAEDNEVVLRLVTQMYEQSLRGDIVLLE